jgi:hypothetical protein
MIYVVFLLRVSLNFRFNTPRLSMMARWKATRSALEKLAEAGGKEQSCNPMKRKMRINPTRRRVRAGFAVEMLIESVIKLFLLLPRIKQKSGRRPRRQ